MTYSHFVIDPNSHNLTIVLCGEAAGTIFVAANAYAGPFEDDYADAAKVWLRLRGFRAHAPLIFRRDWRRPFDSTPPPSPAGPRP